MAGCRICSGELELKVQGNGATVTAEALSPSAHEPGRHGDLLDCRECGTVQQPVLPQGDQLHELYRDMRDDAYLSEETGRRATANRLLDLIAAHVPSGRLLDVGCGHGLLLDEARRRGYETLGLELSREAARHARETPRPRRPRAPAGELQRRHATATRPAASTSSCSPTCSSTSTTRSTRSTAARGCCAPAACSASSRPIRRR